MQFKRVCKSHHIGGWLVGDTKLVSKLLPHNETWLVGDTKFVGELLPHNET